MKKNIKIIIGVILVIIILIVSFNILYKNRNRPFTAKVNMESTNKILNKTNRTYLDTVLVVGLRELDIDSTNIVIRDIAYEETKLLEGFELKGLIVNQGNYYIIYVENTDRKETIEIVAHELIHFKQYYDKRLQIDYVNKTVKWENNYYLPSLPYDQRPWENEAFDKMEDLAFRINEKLYKNYNKSK